MLDKKYHRFVQTSVTCFIHVGDEYLFVKRSMSKRVDPGRLNGIGGRLEKGEDFVSAAIRETHEETGYTVSLSDIQFAGLVKLEEGYEEDWVMAFFRIQVPSKEIPNPHPDEGEFIWLHKDSVLSSGYELVDDLTYTFEDIVKEDSIIFQTAILNEQQKIVKTSINKLRGNG